MPANPLPIARRYNGDRPSGRSPGSRSSPSPPFPKPEPQWFIGGKLPATVTGSRRLLPNFPIERYCAPDSIYEIFIHDHHHIIITPPPCQRSFMNDCLTDEEHAGCLPSMKRKGASLTGSPSALARDPLRIGSTYFSSKAFHAPLARSTKS